MNYKTYKCNSFNVHTIKTNKFKTAHMEIIFRKKIVKEELTTYSLLADILSLGNIDYPKRKDLIVKLEELYKSIIYATALKTGNIMNFSVISDFINPEYINDESYLENIIKLTFDLLQRPNVINEEFDLKSFNITKNKLKKEIEAIKDNPVNDSVRKALKAMDSNSPSSYFMLDNLEDLENITPSSLYKAYKRLMKDFACDIFIIGDLDMDNVVSLIKKYFKKRYIVELNEDLKVVNEERKKVQVKEIDGNNIQANLVAIFNVNNLDEKEQDIVMHVFNYLYGNGGLMSKLYQSIREKNSLCYAINSMYLKYDSLLVVQLSLENDCVNKAVSLIKKELKSMIQGNFSIDELKDACNNMMVSIDISGDNNISVLNNYVFHEFANLMLLEDRKKAFKNVTKEEVINVARKIKLNTIFTLKGGN